VPLINSDNVIVWKGIVFKTMVAMKIWLVEYTMFHHYPFIVKHSNENKCYVVICRRGCPSTVHARRGKDYSWRIMSVPYRLGTATYKFQVKIRSGACTHALPRALQHRTLPPSKGGLRGCHVLIGSRSCLRDRKGSGTTTCTVAPDPASLQGRAPVHHVFYSSRSYPPVREGSGASRVLQLRILPHSKGGL
jgi:hypothetical protein